MSEVHRYSVVKMLTEAGNKIIYDPHGPEVVLASAFDALTQRCRELQEDRQRTADELVAFVHGEHSAVCAERDTLRGLLAECAEYLNTNNLTSIGHGSILHRKMIDAAMDVAR